MKKIQMIKDPHEGQFLYQDRWVDKKNFRAFVYSSNGPEKLANSYEEYESLISSGLWFSVKPQASKERKLKHVTLRTAS